MSKKVKQPSLEAEKWRLRKEGELYYDPELLRARHDSENYLALFMKNMTYLLAKRGMTKTQLIENIRSRRDLDDVITVPMAPDQVYPPNLFVLTVISNFLGARNVGQMLCVNIEEFEKDR